MKPGSTNKNLANWILTQSLWFVCVLGGDWFALAAGIFYWVVYASCIGNLQREWISIMIITAIGFSTDAALSFFGLLTFSTNLPVPLWLLVLWSGFATVFHYGLNWLHAKPLVATVIGAIAGPATYFAGINLSGSVIDSSLLVFIIVYVMLWAIYMPLFLFIAKKFIATDLPGRVYS